MRILAILNVQVDEMRRSGAWSDITRVAQAWFIVIVQVLQGRCVDPLGKVHVLLFVIGVTLTAMMLCCWVT